MIFPIWIEVLVVGVAVVLAVIAARLQTEVHFLGPLRRANALLREGLLEKQELAELTAPAHIEFAKIKQRRIEGLEDRLRQIAALDGPNGCAASKHMARIARGGSK